MTDFHFTAVQETGVQSLGQEDPLEEGMATHSNILAWRIPDRGAWWATVHGVAESWTQPSNQAKKPTVTIAQIQPAEPWVQGLECRI